MTARIKTMLKRLLYGIFSPVRLLTRPRNRRKEQVEDKVVLPNKYLLAQVRMLIQEGHTVTINVKGYSMRPFLEHLRDKVIIGPFETLHVGDVALAEIAPGTYVLHRIIALEDDGRVILMGDGNLKGKETCSADCVAGVVKTFIRNGKQIAADDESWVRYGHLWRRLLPVRRMLLLIYRLNLEESK